MIHALKKVTFSLILATMLWSVVEFLTYKYFRDHQYWYNYHTIDAEKPVNLNDRDLWHVSRLDVTRGGWPVAWSDVLRCRPWGTDIPFGFVSRHETGHHSMRVGNDKVSRWRYPREKLPNFDAECYDDSTITMMVMHFIPKIQEIESSTYRVMPAEDEEN